MKRILYLLLLVLLSSCTTNYYAMYMVEDVLFMASSSDGSAVRTVVTKGLAFTNFTQHLFYPVVEYESISNLFSGNASF